MGGICEHAFLRKDPKNPDYSMTEYDLYAKTGLTLRKNLKHNRYEIVKIKSREVEHSTPDLQAAVDKCNDVEGYPNTKIECAVLCQKGLI